MTSNPVMLDDVIFTDAEDWVYALPLIPDALNGAADTQGVVAKVDKNGIPEFKPPTKSKTGVKTYALPEKLAFLRVPRYLTKMVLSAAGRRHNG